MASQDKLKLIQNIIIKLGTKNCDSNGVLDGVTLVQSSISTEVIGGVGVVLVFSCHVSM